MQECNGFGCPWIQNRHDENHWVCLRCGKDRYISRRTDPVDFFIIISAIALLITLIVGTNSSTPSSPESKIQPESDQQTPKIQFVDSPQTW